MKGIRLSPQAIAAQLALRKVPSPFGHPSYGRGGRQSNAGITAAVFGNTGFIGKYVMGELGTRGCKVYAPYRGCELEGRHLKTSFDLGNVRCLFMFAFTCIIAYTLHIDMFLLAGANGIQRP